MWVVNKKKTSGKIFLRGGESEPQTSTLTPPHTHTSVPSSNAHAFLEEKKTLRLCRGY